MTARDSEPPVKRKLRLRAASIVLRKELFEIFRDRRNIMLILVGPMLLTPALMALMGYFMRGQTEHQVRQRYRVAIVDVTLDSPVIAEMRRSPHLELFRVAARDAAGLIRKGDIRAALAPPLEKPRGATTTFRILHDPGSQESLAAAGALDAAVRAASDREGARRLRAAGLPPDLTHPFETSTVAIPASGSQSTLLLSIMLPYLLIVTCFSGSIHAAFDQVAGEKERGTLETLLVSPVSRYEIVLGKFSAVVVVSVLTSVVSLLGLSAVLTSRYSVFASVVKGGLHISLTSLAVAACAMVPLSIVFAGLLLAISTAARNQKEAQTFLGPLFALVMVPALASVFLGESTSPLLALVPVLNASILVRHALTGSYDVAFTALAAVSCAVYALAAIAFATRLFQREEVLLKV